MNYNYLVGRSIRRTALALLLSCLVGAYVFSSQLAPSVVRSGEQAAAPEQSVEEKLVAIYPGLARRLQVRTEFKATTRAIGGSEVAGWIPTIEISETKREAKERERSSAFFPANCADPFLGNGAAALIQPTNASAQQAQIENSKLVYHNPYPQTDSLYIASAERVEAFMLLRAPGSPARFEFSIKAADSATQITMKDGAVLFTGSGGGLKLDAPWAIDATRHVTLARWVLDPAKDDASRLLNLEVMTQGLVYPLIVHTGWRTLQPVTSAAQVVSVNPPGSQIDPKSSGFTLDLHDTVDNTPGGAHSDIGPVITLPEAVVSGTVTILDNGELDYRVNFADSGDGTALTAQLFEGGCNSGTAGDTSCFPAVSANNVQIQETAPTTTYDAGVNIYHISGDGCTSITCPANITKSNDPNQCGAMVTYAVPTDCTGTTCSPASNSFFPVGTTTVTCTNIDGPTCTFTITVQDKQPPTITCPANVTQCNDPDKCGAVVTYPPPTASDNCPGVTTMCSPASGSFFQKGTTTVTCTATDASSNTASCTFTVTVNDCQPPTITCPQNQTVTATASCPLAASSVVAFSLPTASDNCPGVTVACNPPSGSTFAAGTTMVTCTATDTTGNTATCSFTVTVFSFCLQDETNPGNFVLINANTGEYRFFCNNVLIATGTGTLTTKVCIGTIEHQKGDRRVYMEWDTTGAGGKGAGTAIVQLGVNNTRCQITDKNMSNNTCAPTL